MSGPAWLGAVAQDVRQAVRSLRHSRGFALWVVGSLAVGMTVTLGALAFLNTLLFKPFPAVTAQERLVRVSVSRGCGRPDCWIRMSSPADIQALQEGLTGLQGLASYTQGQVAVGLPEARAMRAALTSANYFEVLGVRPIAGRAFDANDASTHAAVAVIAHSVWLRDFDGDRGVVGRSIRVGDAFVQIVGVAPPRFLGIDLRPARGDRGQDIWLPLWLADRVLPPTRAEASRQERDLATVGRLRDGVQPGVVQAEAGVVALRLAATRAQPSSPAMADVQGVWMSNPQNRKLTIGVLLPIPLLVLLIACVNAANLMLAHGSRRQRDIAIRLALGAGRRRIVRQLLVESAVLALLATAVAVPIAWTALRLASTPLSVPIPIDATVLALAVLTAAGTAVAFGLAPAVRVSAQQPSRTLGSAGSRSDAPPRQSRMRRLLVVAQVALSLGLMATAWQLVATVRYQVVSAGTPADRLLIARFDLRPVNLPAGENDSFYRRLAHEAVRLPGVETAGLARHASVWTFGQGSAPGSLLVWLPSAPPDEGKVTVGGYAGGDLFRALGLRVVQGRAFADGDRLARPQVAVVNQTFAESMEAPPVRAPIGEPEGAGPRPTPALGATIHVAPRDRPFGSSIPVRIVGVIESTIEPRYAPGERPAPKVYLPSPIEPEPALALYMRTSRTAAALTQPVRELVRDIAPRVPILDIGSLSDLNEQSFGAQLWLARAAALIGVIGLLLATAGLYAVSSYFVAMRGREIAIRMAIGARPRTILAMILGQSMRMALAGLLVGGSAAIVVSRLIQAEYHGIHGIDGISFAGSVGLFLAAMLLASAIPAVRASRVDPVQNLKND